MAQTPPKNPGAWDVEFNGIAIEFDEEQHFNRFRAITLQSPLYDRLTGGDWKAYARRCVDWEDACLKKAGSRGYWSNASCERSFGEAGKERDISGCGAPRWKQRAFYDFLKDVSTALLPIKLARLTPDDRLCDCAGARTLADALTRPTADTAERIAELTTSRAQQS